MREGRRGAERERERLLLIHVLLLFLLEYPEVPYGLSLSPTDSLQYQLSWKLHRSPPPLVSSLNYRIYINHSLLLKTVPLQELGTNGIGSFFVSIGASDMQFDHAPLTPPLSLSIRVSDDVHISSFSSSLPLPSQLYDLVLIKEHHDDTSSVTSVLSNGVGVASSSLLTSNSGSSLPEITEGMEYIHFCFHFHST